MVFGLEEGQDENLNKKVGELLLELNVKPQVEVCRVGLSGISGSDEVKNRPVKVSVGSSATVMEIFNKAKLLKDTVPCRKVFLSLALLLVSRTRDILLEEGV